ncbi:hypothetical protein AQUCO_00700026v1 [Aquilegia coerulea]|uniref:Uncharacterized protein n=1 Tax=Aquilegia coerulea TaxID=218851 RepID=A0A2G5EI54_AQUCA|nr:hypothetical protein AQUCO_00700026v1 [Aquilegia coerulea]
MEKVFEESYDLESAIKSLNELCLGSANRDIESATVKTDRPSQGIENNGSGTVTWPVSNLPKNGAEWVELLVNEMQSSSDIDDAKTRASKVLEALEKTIHTQAVVEGGNNMHKEIAMLKEQMEVLIRENGILKRAVAIQHERRKEANKSSTELQHLNQLVGQYQERVRTLEVNNYALSMHLKQAQESNFMPACFYPDIF